MATGVAVGVGLGDAAGVGSAVEVVETGDAVACGAGAPSFPHPASGSASNNAAVVHGARLFLAKLKTLLLPPGDPFANLAFETAFDRAIEGLRGHVIGPVVRA